MAADADKARHDQAEAGRNPDAEEIRAQLEQMLSSPALHLSQRRRALLSYLVDETVAGHGDRLKGTAVALSVFERDETFNSSSDPVVRIEARRLRRDLDSYYINEGRDDPIRITIPKGAYVAHFAWQHAPSDMFGDPDRRIAPSLLATAPASSEAVADLLAEPSPAPAEPSLPMVVRAQRADRRRSMVIWSSAAAAAILLLIVLIVLIGLALGNRRSASNGMEALGPPAVIVLPFDALSPNEDDKFLAAGMTEEIATNLLRFPDFRLFSIQAAFKQYPNADPIELGQSLGATYVVSGSIRSDGSHLRVGALLTHAATGRLLWSESYVRPLTPANVFAVQSELSASIASTLGQPYGVVLREEVGRLAAAETPEMSSYACVLRAYQYRRTFQISLYAPTLACLEAAVARDHDYAEAWAMLGWLHLDAARFEWTKPGETDREYELAFEAASRGLAADPRSGLALKALSSIQHYSGHFADSERLARAALALNPNDPDALAQLGWRLAVRGNFDEGIPYLEYAIARSVSPPGWYYHLIAAHHFLEGNYRAMLEAAERSNTDGSVISLSLIVIAHGGLGNRQAAREELHRLAEKSPAFVRDPASAYRRHQATDQIVRALVSGLRRAGWTEAMP